MRIKKIVLLGAGVLIPLVSFASLLSAQSDPPPPPNDAPQQVMPSSRGADEIHQLIEAFYIARLQEALKLTDEQYATLIPAVKNYLRVRQQGAQAKNEMERSLNQLLESSAADDQIQAKMKELDQVKKQNEQNLERAQAEIDSKLDVRQRVRFRQYQQQVDQRISRMLQQVREGRRMQRMREGLGRQPGFVGQHPPREGLKRPGMAPGRKR